MIQAKAKRYISALLAAVLLLSLAACGKKDPPADGEDYVQGELAGTEVGSVHAADSIFSLNTRAKEGFNPYVTKSTDNQLLCQLVYENIFNVDEDFNLSSRIITDYEDKDGTYWYFHVDTSILMHDGEKLTAADVAYSIQQAMIAARYAGRFSYVWGASASDENTVAVSLSTPNEQLPYLLTVPVIKNGSKGENTPIGTGAYKFAEDKKSLVAFDGYPNWKDLPVDTIGMKEYDSTEEGISAYEDSYIDLVLNDPASSTNLGYGGGNEQRYFTTNNMHYLGINMKSPCLRDTAIRYALQYAVDRKYAAKTLMHGAAAAASLPISPASPLYNTELASKYAYNMEKCEKVLANAGVQDYDADGKLEYMVTGIPMELALDLIVCGESTGKADTARKFKEDLGAIGFTVNIRELPWDEYLQALEDGEFDIYYGEVRLTADFSLTRLLTEEGDLNYCEIEDPSYGAYIEQYLAAGDDMRKNCCDILLQYITETAPIIPICFEKQEVITHRNVASGLILSQYNIFQNFPDWTINFD
ncbi:MAG: ABC transporter substrate-binding protein [Oscillospiraceae bacterium]